MSVTLHLGNAVEWARQYSGDPFHALLADAPYEMEFMGKDWDGSGVAFDPETWAAFASVLYPGAFLFVFAGTINDDLISVAMREAGLRKFHKMMGWVYGSGFPKATRLNHGHPKTEIFEGHRYGLQALKPAIETVLIFQKPYSGRPIDNITETGAGVLNVDGGRIPMSEGDQKGEFGIHAKELWGKENTESVYGGAFSRQPADNSSGRWPANFYLGDAEAARRLDEQSGNLHGAGNKKATACTIDKEQVYAGGWKTEVKNPDYYSDSGGASRFFFRVSEQIDDADPVRYVAKASRRERDAGLDGFELQERKTQGRAVVREIDRKDGRGVVPVNAQIQPARNMHPTIKPLALTRYLATLLLPPAEYAPCRLFVPFAGVASECIGGMQAGWDEVVGVELTEEYLPIARARVEYWQRQGVQMELT